MTHPFKIFVLSLALTFCFGNTVTMSGNSRHKARSVKTAIVSSPKATLTTAIVKALGFGGQTFKKKKNGVWTIGKSITVYSSQPFGSKIRGFAGPTPVFVAVNRSGKIVSVAPAPNEESPEYFDAIKKSGLFQKWNGMTLKKATTYAPDAITGATYSSAAVIRNVQATAKGVSK